MTIRPQTPRQGVRLSDFCRAIGVMRNISGNFWSTRTSKRGPVEIYLEMELLRLLDRFLDRVLCFATEGCEQHSQF